MPRRVMVSCFLRPLPVLQLAAIALCSCARLQQGDTPYYSLPRELPYVFAQCEPGEVARVTATRYRVIACGRIAIYRCGDDKGQEHSPCIRERAESLAAIAAIQRRATTSHAGLTPAGKQGKADRLFVAGRELYND